MQKIKVSKLIQILKWFVYILPAVLFFSYYPIISFGSGETMNFELSLPLIWLVLFDIMGIVLLINDKKERKNFCNLKKQWPVFLFPVFASLSVIWSVNRIRGIMTVGILWLVYFAVLGIWHYRKELLKDSKFKSNFLKWFLGSTLVICVWCLVQCVLDLAGVGREVSLMCPGCVTRMFGFPHPNGFAIEPQFMGNLLIAPTLMAGWLILHSNYSGSRFLCSKFFLFCFFVFTTTLFLTFSRGAIYAFVVGMIFFTVMQVVKTKKWRAMLLWPIVILAFIFTLNLQGIFAQLSHTNDTYFTGISKVLNHLSLGIIDFGGEKTGDVGAIGEINSAETIVDNNAVFDGYVAESTNIRMELSKAAFNTWKGSAKNILIGTGIGGAGQAMYEAGQTDSPKEIVQNEYVSVLLEFGIVGVALIILIIIILMRVIIKNTASGVTLAIMVSYAISLLFFAGLANALQIYLLPVLILLIENSQISLRKKLVS